jgi:invasin B
MDRAPIGLTTDLAGMDRAEYRNEVELLRTAGDLSRVSADVAKAAQKTAQALFATSIPVDGENAETVPGNDRSKPALTPPAGKHVFSGAVLTQLLGALNELLGKDALAEWTSNLASRKEAAEAHRKTLEGNANEFGDAVDAADAAVNAYAAAKEQSAAAKTGLDSAKEQADAAEAELQSLEHDDPARPQVLHKYEIAQKALLAATQKHTAAVANEKTLSTDVLQKVRIATDVEKRVNAESNRSPLRRGEQPELTSSAARLSLLMAEMTRLMGDGAEANMKADQEFMKEIQTERQKALEKSAADYAAEVEKAEQANKTMGCIGKIIGGIILAVSIIAIPFTAGASLALAVIGVGLTVADMVTEAVTGTSLTEMALAPVMKALQKLVELVGKVISDALEAAGVPPEKAKMIGNILASVAVAVIMIAVMIGVAIVARGPAVTKMFQSVVKTGSKMLANVTKETAKKATMLSDIASSSLKLWGQGNKTYGEVAVGVHTRNAADASAEMEFSRFTVQQVERYLTDAAETFGRIFKNNQRFTEIATNAMQSQARLGKEILGNMGRGRA